MIDEKVAVYFLNFFSTFLGMRLIIILYKNKIIFLL